MAAIVRHIKTGVFYEYLGENKFVNLCTGQSGIVSDELAKKIFRINLDATEMISKYPGVKDLIQKLNLISLN